MKNNLNYKTRKQGHTYTHKREIGREREKIRIKVIASKKFSFLQ